MHVEKHPPENIFSSSSTNPSVLQFDRLIDQLEKELIDAVQDTDYEAAAKLKKEISGVKTEKENFKIAFLRGASPLPSPTLVMEKSFHVYSANVQRLKKQWEEDLAMTLSLLAHIISTSAEQGVDVLLMRYSPLLQGMQVLDDTHSTLWNLNSKWFELVQCRPQAREEEEKKVRKWEAERDQAFKRWELAKQAAYRRWEEEVFQYKYHSRPFVFKTFDQEFNKPRPIVANDSLTSDDQDSIDSLRKLVESQADNLAAACRVFQSSTALTLLQETLVIQYGYKVGVVGAFPIVISLWGHLDHVVPQGTDPQPRSLTDYLPQFMKFSDQVLVANVYTFDWVVTSSTANISEEQKVVANLEEIVWFGHRGVTERARRKGLLGSLNFYPDE